MRASPVTAVTAMLPRKRMIVVEAQFLGQHLGRGFPGRRSRDRRPRTPRCRRAAVRPIALHAMLVEAKAVVLDACAYRPSATPGAGNRSGGIGGISDQHGMVAWLSASKVGPVQRHHDGVSARRRYRAPTARISSTLIFGLESKTIHLLGRMLGGSGRWRQRALGQWRRPRGSAAQHAIVASPSEATRLACRSSPSTPARTCLIWLLDNRCSRMTIVSLDRLLCGGRFVGSRGGQSRLGEFARICRRRRSCDSFRNRPYGPPILLCPKGNEGMSEERDPTTGRMWSTCALSGRAHGVTPKLNYSA